MVYGMAVFGYFMSCAVVFILVVRPTNYCANVAAILVAVLGRAQDEHTHGGLSSCGHPGTAPKERNLFEAWLFWRLATPATDDDATASPFGRRGI